MSLFSDLLPYVHGKKQATALFTVMLLLALSHRAFDVPRGAFDAPHAHVESVSVVPTTMNLLVASGTPITRSFHLPIEHLLRVGR